MTVTRLVRQGMLTLLLLVIGISTAVSATRDRAPRDYYIYLDYSASIVGPNRPNKQLGGMLKSMLLHRDATNTPMYLPGKDRVFVYRFGLGLQPLANDWEIALDTFTAENKGDKVTDLRPVLRDMRERIADSRQQTSSDFRAKIFIIASDFVHDALRDKNNTAYDGCAAKDLAGVSAMQQKLAAQVLTLPKEIKSEDENLELNIPVGLVYYPTTPRYINNKRAGECFTQQINKEVLLKAFETHFDTQRLTYDDSGDFADSFAQAMSDLITAQFKDLTFNTEQPDKPTMRGEKMSLPLLIDNPGIVDTTLYGIRIWKDRNARTPLSRLIRLRRPVRVSGGSIGLSVKVPIPADVTQKIRKETRFYVELVEERKKDSPAERGRIRGFESPEPGRILFSNDTPGLTQIVGSDFRISLPIVNGGESTTQFVGIRLRESATAAVPFGTLIPINPARVLKPGASATLPITLSAQQLGPLLENDRYYIELVDENRFQKGTLPATPSGDLREYLPPVYTGTKLQLLPPTNSWWDPESSLFSPTLMVRIRNSYFKALPTPSLVLRIVKPGEQLAEAELVLAPVGDSSERLESKKTQLVSYPVTDQKDIAELLYRSGDYQIYLETAGDGEPTPQPIPRLTSLYVSNIKIDSGDLNPDPARQNDQALVPLSLSFTLHNSNPLSAQISEPSQQLAQLENALSVQVFRGEVIIPKQSTRQYKINLLKSEFDLVDPLLASLNGQEGIQDIGQYEGIPVSFRFPLMDNFVPGLPDPLTALVEPVNRLEFGLSRPKEGSDPSDDTLKLEFKVTNNGPLPEMITELELGDENNAPKGLSLSSPISPPLPAILGVDETKSFSVSLAKQDRQKLQEMDTPFWVFKCLRGIRDNSTDGEHCGERMEYSFDIKPLSISEPRSDKDNRWSVDQQSAVLTLRLKNDSTWPTYAQEAQIRTESEGSKWYPISAFIGQEGDNAVKPGQDKPVQFRLLRRDWPSDLFQCNQMTVRVKTDIEESRLANSNNLSSPIDLKCPLPTQPMEYSGKAHWESAVIGQEQNILVVELLRHRDASLPNRPEHLFFNPLGDERPDRDREVTLPDNLEWASDQNPNVTYRFPVDRQTLSQEYFAQDQVQVLIYDRSSKRVNNPSGPVSFSVVPPAAAPIQVQNVISSTGLPVLKSDRDEESINLTLTNPNANLPQEITKLRWYIQRDASKADMEFGEDTHPDLFPIRLKPGQSRSLTFPIPDSIKPEWKTRIRQNRTAFVHATTASLQLDEPKNRSLVETVQIKVDLKVNQIQLISSGEDQLSITYDFTVDNKSDTLLREDFEAQIRERSTNKLLAFKRLKDLKVSNNQKEAFTYRVVYKKTDAIGPREIDDIYGAIARVNNAARYASKLPDSGILATLIYRVPDLLRYGLIGFALFYYLLRVAQRRKQDPNGANQIMTYLPRWLELLGLSIAALSAISFNYTPLVENFAYTGWILIIAMSYGLALLSFDLAMEYRFSKELRASINSGAYRGHSLRSIAALLGLKYRGLSILLLVASAFVLAYLLWPSLQATPAESANASTSAEDTLNPVVRSNASSTAATETETQP